MQGENDVKVLGVIIAGLLGLVVGAAIGFGFALWIAKPRNDGTFGMREMLVCLPVGALIGLAMGVWWGVKTRLFG